MTIMVQNRTPNRAMRAIGARIVGTAVMVFASVASPAAAMAIELPLGAAEGAPAVTGIVQSGVDDFTFRSYDADFFLDRDAAGRSTLLTVETFVAVFPADQNHGMRRAIPNDYKGSPIEPTNISVEDESGAARPFEVSTDGDFTLVTSAADSFVDGEQTYVFSYQQSNVTRYAGDTAADEFYWDTNGDGWNQSFTTATATVHLGEGLSDALIAPPDCYWGIRGSSSECEITASDSHTFVATHSPLAPRQNITVAFGFSPGTFVARDSSYWGSPASYGQLVGLVAALGALVWAIRLRRTTLADAAGRPTIIAEYAPPRGVSIVTSALVLTKRDKAIAAQILDFAVQGRLRILDKKAKKFLFSYNEYRLELVDSAGVHGHQLGILTALFGPSLRSGSVRNLTTPDTELSEVLRKLLLSERSGLVEAGYRRKVELSSFFPLMVAVAAVVLSFLFGSILITGSYGSAFPFVVIGIAIAAALVSAKLLFRTPLTAQGAELRDHLEGLELYIRLAEADRLRMLQSPDGALREVNESTGDIDVLKVYEKLLPYAVLFGLEEMWSTQLSRYYAESSPSWYSGSGAFSGVVFASSISSISSSIASSYSGSASSSSSGGSGGGGSSGGGGGGGGGGGV